MPTLQASINAFVAASWPAVRAELLAASPASGADCPPCENPENRKPASRRVSPGGAPPAPKPEGLRMGPPAPSSEEVN